MFGLATPTQGANWEIIDTKFRQSIVSTMLSIFLGPALQKTADSITLWTGLRCAKVGIPHPEACAAVVNTAVTVGIGVCLHSKITSNLGKVLLAAVIGSLAQLFFIYSSDSTIPLVRTAANKALHIYKLPNGSLRSIQMIVERIIQIGTIRRFYRTTDNIILFQGLIVPLLCLSTFSIKKIFCIIDRVKRKSF